MSRTRNQRRRDNFFEWFFRVLFFALLILCLLGLAKQCRDIRELEEKIGSTSITIVGTQSFLPEGFDPQSEIYQAALQRYDIENGLVFPESFEQKEAAPEMAVSEADRCKGAS